MHVSPRTAGKMENPSFVHDSEGRDANSTVEMGEIERKAFGCPQACVSLQKQQQLKEKRLPESPWHHLKTIFLVGTLVLLAAWIVVYVTLSQTGAL
ncbi:uncharacterized protein LOC134530335 isoform X2 [Bacillus rossius redtenbacheri]|uniref:uncharacterized protein LOC134530335 isoform X2 n=1 Tax=Bacillus rossius redtenbacheri TaxID=93214 RepID=UPI002FDCB427